MYSYFPVLSSVESPSALSAKWKAAGPTACRAECIKRARIFSCITHSQYDKMCIYIIEYNSQRVNITVKDMSKSQGFVWKKSMLMKCGYVKINISMTRFLSVYLEKSCVRGGISMVETFPFEDESLQNILITI